MDRDIKVLLVAGIFMMILVLSIGVRGVTDILRLWLVGFLAVVPYLGVKREVGVTIWGVGWTFLFIWVCLL